MIEITEEFYNALIEFAKVGNNQHVYIKTCCIDDDKSKKVRIAYVIMLQHITLDIRTRHWKKKLKENGEQKNED